MCKLHRESTSEPCFIKENERFALKNWAKNRKKTLWEQIEILHSALVDFGRSGLGTLHKLYLGTVISFS